MAKKNFNANRMEYKGISFQWKNLRTFHTMFMEAMADSWQYDLEKEKLRQGEGLSDKREIEINMSFEPLKAEITELYKIIWGLRVQIQNSYNTDQKVRDSFDEICKTDFVTWNNYFVWSRDPRLISLGLRPDIPFILTENQQKAILKIHSCWEGRRNVLVEKSRAEGITELLCSYDVWHWLNTRGYQGLWGSRVRDLVDKLGSPGAIFERIRRMIYSLPVKMVPEPYKNRKNDFDKLFNIENPDMDTFLRGESGINIGRGDRCATAKVDEKAHIEDPVSCDDSLAYTTDCQIDISTPNGQDHFYEKRNSGKVEVITLWWYQNPSKNKNWRTGKRPQKGECAWYEYQELTRDSVLIAKEIDINYLASVKGSMIPAEWVQSAIDLDLEADGPVIAGLDLAAGGKDSSIYITRQGPVASLPQTIPFESPIRTSWMAADIASRQGVDTLIYDRGGLGEDVYTILKEGDRRVKFDLIGLYGNQRASDRLYEKEGLRGHEKFRNGRAEWWWEMRRRFEKTFLYVNNQAVFPSGELISVPSGDQEFLNQISSPLMVMTPNGKIGVESKKEMASRNVKSPDKADAFIYSFFNRGNANTVVPNFNYANSSNYHNFKIDFERVQDIYVSIFHTEDMTVHVLVCAWDFNLRRLRLYSELEYSYFEPEAIFDEIREVIDYSSVKAWIGNEGIFKGLEKNRHVLLYDYKKAGMKIQGNWSHDPKQSINLADTMFRENRLQVHDTCSKTMNQVRNWMNIKGQPQNHLYFALCLCQILTTLKRKKVIYDPTPKKPLIYNMV